MIDIVMFICILFIGSDTFAINIGNYNFRIIQFLMMFATFLFLIVKKYKMNRLVIFLLFIVSNLLSLFNSYSVNNSIMYLIWTIYNYIFVFCLFYSWGLYTKWQKIYKMWRTTILIQGALVIVQFLGGFLGIKILNSQVYFGITRPAIWFYEPSYLATYLSVFFTISLYMYLSTHEKKYKKDFIITTIFIFLTTSSTGYIAIVVGIIMSILFLETQVIRKLYDLFRVIVATVVLAIPIYIIYPQIFTIFIGRLFTTDLSGSSGERMTGWAIAQKVFEEHKIFGIGANAFESFTGLGTPPTNITLELLATLGLVGLVTFSIFIFSLIFKGFINAKYFDDEKRIFIKAVIVAFIVFLIALQANQNYLRLYMWMHMGILAGIATINSKKLQKL